MHDDDDRLVGSYRKFKPPGQAQLLENARAVGRVGKAVERITLHGSANNARFCVDALFLAWDALLVEMCWLAYTRSTAQPLGPSSSSCRGGGGRAAVFFWHP